MKVLGFPAVYYIIKKKQDHLFLPHETSSHFKSPECVKINGQRDYKRYFKALENEGHTETVSRSKPASGLTSDYELPLKTAAIVILINSLRIPSYETCKMLTKIVSNVRRLPLKS